VGRRGTPLAHKDSQKPVAGSRRCDGIEDFVSRDQMVRDKFGSAFPPMRCEGNVRFIKAEGGEGGRERQLDWTVAVRLDCKKQVLLA
jgi:hypothetical protein